MGGRDLCCRCATCCNTILKVVIKCNAHCLVVHAAFHKHGMQPGAHTSYTKKNNGLPLQAISSSCLLF